jgi:electron transfer flavoprotein beta subunit
MGYECLVLAKQVPDTKLVTGNAMNEDGTVNRAALPAIFNPEDLNALELALSIRERYGGTVTVATMGLPKACDILREALYRGADRVILLTDRRAAASDTLATSYILNCVVRKLAGVGPKGDLSSKDNLLILCGRQAIDGDTAQVGPQIAEKLGMTQITYVEELQELKNSDITVRRSTGHGWEKVQAKLPVLLTVMETANEPRPAGARRVMKYKKARAAVELGKEPDPALLKELADKGLLIEQWDLDKVQADLNWCGKDGSPTKVHRIQSVVLTTSEHKRIDPTDEGLRGLVRELIEDHTIG